MRRASSEEAWRRNASRTYGGVRIDDELRIRALDVPPGELLFRVNRYTRDEQERWWYSSDHFGVTVYHGDESIFLFHVRRGRVRECAFSGQLVPRKLRSAIGLLRRNGLEGWVLPGLRGFCRFHCGRSLRSMDPEVIIAACRTILAWERRGVGSVELPRLSHQREPAPKEARGQPVFERRYGDLRITRSGTVRLSEENPSGPLVYKTVRYRGRQGRGWWYGDAEHTIYVEHGGGDVFSLQLENGRAVGAAFPPCLEVHQIRRVAELLDRQGLGGWLTHAAQRTLGFLGSQHVPDARKIGTFASLLLEWGERG